MQEKIRTFTNLTITSKNNQSLKRYFNSLKRNLPTGWSNSHRKNYVDDDTFKIIIDRTCLRLPKFEDNFKKVVMTSYIHIGLTESSIIVLKIDFDKKIPSDDSLDLIGYTLHSFHESILKPNKHYNSFNHIFELGGPYDENWYKTDLRDQRSLKLYSKADEKTYFLSKNELTKINNIEISYSAPNNIALSLSLMKKALLKAAKIFKILVSDSKDGKVNVPIFDNSMLYDYFEEIQTSIIFSFIAIEGFSNAAIPEDYKYERVNDKGIPEIWNKENIQRWMSTSDKLGTIIPMVLKSEDIKKKSFWVKFKELEKLRNDIVHQKTIDNGTKLDAKLYHDMLNQDVMDKITSTLNVIDFFYSLDNAHPYFPLGLGVARFQIHEIESFAKYFKHLD